MATVATTPSVETLPRRANPLWQFIKVQPLGVIGLLIILVYTACALGAGWIAPYDPEEIDFAAMLGAPSMETCSGTDQYGRDVFSRIVFGARTALAVGILSALFGCTVGALIGAASGYFGGRIDNLIQRRGRHHAVVSHHRAGDGGGGRARQAHRVRRGLEPDCGDRLADHPQGWRAWRDPRRLSIVAIAVIDAARAPASRTSASSCATSCPTSSRPYLIMVTAFYGPGHPAGSEPVVPGAGRD
jgi:peptide/nickel transport system permease protein